MKIDQANQFDMSYAGDGRFADLLKRSDFFMLLELNASTDAAAIASCKELLLKIATEPRIASVVIDDRLDEHCKASDVKLAEEASALTAKPVMCVVSGKGRSQDEVNLTVNKARAMGLRDFIAVTGNLLEKHRESDNEPTRRGEYTDSVDILRIIASSGNDNTMGATVNPFKYYPEGQAAQYVKLMRKINNGAKFVISQAGWDMKKYQELVWFLRSREVLLPLVARVPCVSDVTTLANLMDENPGIPVPLLVSSLAEQKSEENEYVSAMIALGCHLLGYSGIQWVGIQNAAQLTSLLQKMDELATRLTTYKEWALEWNRKYAEVSLLPFAKDVAKSTPFYLYNALMIPSLQNFDLATANPSSQTMAPPAIADRLQSRLAAPDTPQWIKKTASHLTKHPLDDDEYLAPCFGLDNGSCPKRLTQGPCGNSSIDGMCEQGHFPCFFNRIIRLAQWNRQIDFLEDKKE